ncbi:MAG: cytochrome b [Alphaproteobacteria bacterium]|nr:cytochrome b [Alphaproteobacteria bacterium]
MSHADAPAYGPVAKLLHWLVVMLLVAQFIIAWTMPPIHRGTTPETLISLHLSLGVVILLVIAVRIVWRLTHPAPAEPGDMPVWQRLVARATHGLLYAILVALPLLGWANASARGWKVTLFDILPLPPLVPTGSAVGHAMGDIHGTLATILLIVAGLHVAAALFHAVLRGDGVLQRMLPSRS